MAGQEPRDAIEEAREPRQRRSGRRGAPDGELALGVGELAAPEGDPGRAQDGRGQQVGRRVQREGGSIATRGLVEPALPERDLPEPDVGGGGV
jgi:hypothetical protein